MKILVRILEAQTARRTKYKINRQICPSRCTQVALGFVGNIRMKILISSKSINKNKLRTAELIYGMSTALSQKKRARSRAPLVSRYTAINLRSYRHFNLYIYILVRTHICMHCYY